MRSKKFADIIRQLGVGAHDKKFVLKPGDFTIPPEIFSDFRKLFDVHGTKKNVGNGEVAVYWLFDKEFGGLYDVSRERKRGGADLVVGGKYVEVKSSSRGLNTSAFKMGKFEELHDLRRQLNIVFGAYNVFAAGSSVDDKHGDRSYLSESSFGVNGLARAFRCALDNAHAPNVKKVINDELFSGCQTPEEYAVRLLGTIAKEKLMRKVGPDGYVMNINPVRLGLIEVCQVSNLESFDTEMIKCGVRASCSELYINLGIFKRNGE